MPVTLQNVADTARLSLNDDDKTRWPDTDLLAFLQDGLDAMYQLRPDLFLGAFATYASSALTLGSTIPIPEIYRRQLADYVIMRCETMDDESVVDNRASLAYQFFERRLMT